MFLEIFIQLFQLKKKKKLEKHWNWIFVLRRVSTLYYLTINLKAVQKMILNEGRSIIFYILYCKANQILVIDCDFQKYCIVICQFCSNKCWVRGSILISPRYPYMEIIYKKVYISTKFLVIYWNMIYKWLVKEI